MPIDTSIIGRLQPINLQQRDPLEMAGKQFQLMELLRKNQADAKAEQAAQRDMPMFLQLLRGQPAKSMDMGSIDPSMAQFGSIETAPAVEANPAAAYGFASGSQSPRLQQIGQYGFQHLPALEAAKEEKNANREWRTQEAEAARQARMEQQKAQLQQQADLAREARASREEMAAANREHQVEMRRLAASLAGAMRQPEAPVAVMRPDGKAVYVSRKDAIGMSPATKGDGKLPPTALKMQAEELDALGTAGSIMADTNALIGQIDTGKLKFGPVKNLIQKGQNLAGMSDEESRNFAVFQSGLEKLRNDSLRLNKGVQTEGDAVRALNELMTNINDPKVVKRQLQRINEINNRAADLRQYNVEQIRGNFGMEPMDFSRLRGQPAATGLNAPTKPSLDAIFKK